MAEKSICWRLTPRGRQAPTRSERLAASSGPTNLRRIRGCRAEEDQPKETSMTRKLALALAGLLVALGSLGIPQILQANNWDKAHDAHHGRTDRDLQPHPLRSGFESKRDLLRDVRWAEQGPQ